MRSERVGSMSSGLQEKIGTLLERFIDTGVVGCSAAVGTAHGVTAVSRGLSSRVPAKPLATADLLKVASCTKTFVATVLLQLAGEDRIALDRPVSAWFPWLPMADRISLRHLVNHRSGLPEFESHLPVAPGRHWRPKDIVDLAFRVNRPCAPDEATVYSNTGFVLAGMLIEELTGLTLGGAIRSRILDPLGLESTWSSATEDFPHHRLARGFYWRPAVAPGNENLPVDQGGEMWRTETVLEYSDELQDTTDLCPFSSVYAAGDIVSVPSDLVLFLQGLFGGKILDKGMLQEMIRNRTPCGFVGTRLSEAGLGIFGMTYGDRLLLGHQGGLPGYVTVMGHDPGAGISYAISANTGSGNRLSHYATGIHAVLDNIVVAVSDTL